MHESGSMLWIKDLFSIEFDSERVDWQVFKEGVDIFPLYGQENNGASAALLRYQRGAVVPLHEHQGYEHILVLAGSQSDGDLLFERGSLLISKPGSNHRVTSEEGCIVLAIWQAPVKFI